MYGSNLTWFWAWGRKFTWGLCAGRKWFVSSVGIDCFDVWCGWSRLTWYVYAGRRSLCFSVSIEIDLILYGWSKLTSFQRRGRNWLGVENDLVRVWIEMSLVFESGGIEIDLWLLFCMRVEKPCFFLYRLTWLLCGWTKLAWFLYAGRKTLGLVCFFVSICDFFGGRNPESSTPSNPFSAALPRVRTINSYLPS